MATYVTVFGNIFKNLFLLKSDFVGLSVNFQGIINFFTVFLFAGFLMLIYYLIGYKVRLLFFKKSYLKLDIFIDLALGYIVVNSGIAVLGLSSLLYRSIVAIYAGIIIVIALLPHGKFNLKNIAISLINKSKKIFLRKKIILVAVYLFVLIAFMRLIPPEIGEDALGYHTGDPRLFLNNNTTVIKNVISPFVMPAPHLGEMSYVLTEAVKLRDSARYIHFFFYILVVVLLIRLNPYAALFFVTAPVVIQVSSKANVDFQWILLWLLSILLITTQKLKIRDILLSGMLFGGVLATKMWTIAFIPLFAIYFFIFNKKSISRRFVMLFTFIFSAFLVDSIWLLRSYLISGNLFYPMFSKISTLGEQAGALNVNSVLGFNKLMFHIENVRVFSPLFYIALAVLILSSRSWIKQLIKENIFKFVALLFSEYLIVKYHFGRYLLGLYSLAILIVPQQFIVNSKFLKFLLILSYIVMFFYYFTNSLLIVPYGLGWADKNKYLTRVIFKDNANYYNFDNKFNHFINSKDKVATYLVLGFYYANFNYIDVSEIFKSTNVSFNLLEKKGATKLLIRGGDIGWFCKKLKLTNCSIDKAVLLSSYVGKESSFYLYSLSKSL